jgi:hypothetical protein
MANEPHRSNIIRLTGLAGILGAICWTIGDMAIVGENAAAADYPLLMQKYADRISFHGLAQTLPASEARLAFGALIADLSIPLYLIGSWHLYRAVRNSNWLAKLLFALLICGNAYSPLGHAAFYFVAMIYKTMLLVPESAHGALLELGERFHHVLLIAWSAAVCCLAAALTILAALIAKGRTVYPRRAALLLNPMTLIAIGHMLPRLLPAPLSTWLIGAGINIGWLIVYSFSTLYLWNISTPAQKY